MGKNAVIRLSHDAYNALILMSKKHEKSMSSIASELILELKNDVDIERQKLRNEMAEIRMEMKKFATRKDIAAVLYTFCRIGESGYKKERATLGYRMQLGHEIACDFSAITFKDNE